MTELQAVTDYRTKNPDKIYVRDHTRYQRLRIEVSGGDLTHIYTPSIDTVTGGVYLDCRKRKIFAKHLTLAFMRPIHTLVKTLWHLTMIGPLLCEMVHTMRGEQSAREGVKNFGRSLADIVRTPYYGIAMTLHHLYAIVEALFSPNKLYESRDRVGRLERKMLRVESIRYGGTWRLSPCFSPITNIATVHTQYRSWYTTRGLQKYAEGQIAFRRESRNPFNDCMALHPMKRAFVSAAAA